MQVYGGEPPLWSVALPAAVLDTLTISAIAQRDSDSYDHGVWFLGRSRATVPRWAGYAIGCRVVGGYLRQHPDAQPSQFVSLPAEAFDDLYAPDSPR